MPSAVAAEPHESPPIGVPGRSLSRQVLVLAGPVLVEQVLLYLVGLSDTIITGRLLSVDQLAAVTVASYLTWFLGSLMLVVSAGATALVARFVGAGERAAAARITRQAIVLAWIVGASLLALGWPLAPSIVRAMNLRGAAADEAVGYLRIVLTITPLLATQAVGVACLRGAGDTRTGMWVMLLVNSVNIALSWTAAIGAFGLPRLGLRGVALGTAVGEGLGGLLILGVLVHGRAGLRFRLREARLRRDDVRRLLRISLPAAGEGLTNALCQLWFLGLINGLGRAATAAHGVAIRCEAIAFLTIQAFAVAASTLTGQYLGARRPDLARRAVSVAWLTGTVTLCAIGAVVFVFARPMVGLFLGPEQPGVEDLAVPVLRLVAFALPALATINVVGGALRGAGDTRWPWAIVLVGYLLVRLPLTYAVLTPATRGGLGWGLFGAWVAMFADLTVRAILIIARFRQGGWSRVRV
jgi:putative MATE family efflux protein